MNSNNIITANIKFIDLKKDINETEKSIAIYDKNTNKLIEAGQSMMKTLMLKHFGKPNPITKYGKGIIVLDEKGSEIDIRAFEDMMYVSGFTNIFVITGDTSFEDYTIPKEEAIIEYAKRNRISKIVWLKK